MRADTYLVVPLAIAALALGAAGCGSSDDTSSSTSSATASTASASAQPVKLTLITNETGLFGISGKEAEEGVRFAVKQANADPANQHKLDLTVVDTKGTAPGAANAMSQAVRSDADVVIFGTLSDEALAAVPVAQKGGLPTIVLEAGVSGITETGDNIFRVTGSFLDYQGPLLSYMAKQGVKTTAVVYDGDNPTLKELATKTWPAGGKTVGISSVASTEVKGTDADFTAIASKIASEKPDMVEAGLVGAQYPTLYKQLHQDGWNGQFVGAQGLTYGVLDGLGTAADKITFATEFVPETTVPKGKAFAAAFKQSTGQEANLYNGDGDDGVTFLLAGIAKANGVDRTAIKQGLTAASQVGIDGVAGKVTFTARDASIPGIVVTYKKGVRSVPVAGS